MSGEGLRPGEIQLDDDPATATDPPATDPPPGDDPPADDPAPGDDPPAGDDPPPGTDPPPAKHKGAVAELIQLRKENKQLRDRQQQLDSNPVLQRLTPDMQQAFLEGRIQVVPPQSTREAEEARLTSVAEELGLTTQDGKPDLAAARRVDKVIRRTVQEAVEPVRQGSLSEKASSNYANAVAFAEQHGFDVETVREVFDEVASQPNGAELLAQRKVCERLWEGAVGRMVTRGKVAGNGKKPAQTARPPAAIITEETGARRGQQTTQMSAGLQRVYKDNGVDPHKSFTSKHKIDLSGPIDLE